MGTRHVSAPVSVHALCTRHHSLSTFALSRQKTGRCSLISVHAVVLDRRDVCGRDCSDFAHHTRLTTVPDLNGAY